MVFVIDFSALYPVISIKSSTFVSGKDNKRDFYYFNDRWVEVFLIGTTH